jgi:hypothetical protein
VRGLLDECLVGGALLASIIYAVIALGPRNLKRGVALRAAAWVRSVPAMPGLRALSRRLETAAAVKRAGACGGCDECGAATPASSTSALSSTSAPASAGPTKAEIRIPVSTIGKR